MNLKQQLHMYLPLFKLHGSINVAGDIHGGPKFDSNPLAPSDESCPSLQ